MKLFLAQSIPNMCLHPLIGSLDIEGWHWYYLTDASRGFILFKFIKDTSIGERSFAHSAISNDDEFIVVLARY